MALELKVPDLGEGLTEAEIVQWLVKVGDTVAANEPMVEVETAKAVVEISAPRAGVLAHRGGEAGDTLEVGQLLAVITEEGEDWTGGEGGAATTDAVEPVPAAAAAGPSGTAAAPPAAGPIKAVPLVRKLAKDLGIDLATITGTGPGGRIRREDVESAAAAGETAAATDVAGQRGPVAEAAEELSATRRAIAANLTRSWSEIPHVTVWGPADASAVLAARRETGGPLEAYLVGALLPVLAEFPDFNANFDGTTLTRRAAVNMGVAVDTDAGLIVPVVRDVGSLTAADLAGRIEAIIAKATARRLAPADMADGTFTISNVGAVGGGYGTPIIPYGTTAILSVGRARDEVIARGGGIHVAPMFPVALSFDHRIIDGATASRFLNRFTEALQEFGEP